ncbi:MAG: hypothetical protein E7438_08460 [Ruminococcaceae bacterium]|nr:hypothetical protein [Oscillospiraceae bacterium]
MKKWIALLLCAAVISSWTLCASADGGVVTYHGKAGNFIFVPGSAHSPTDLFADFKNVMPGDSITGMITVKNDASQEVKVKIYIRSLGAESGSEAFLSQLRLRVRKREDDRMAYMFDAAANETAQLTDWVYLGTLYSGGEVNLEVILDVPVTLDNEYQNQIGCLDWEFKIEEFPVEEDDPKPPQTGDAFWRSGWVGNMCGSALTVLALVCIGTTKEKWKQRAEKR